MKRSIEAANYSTQTLNDKRVSSAIHGKFRSETKMRKYCERLVVVCACGCLHYLQVDIRVQKHTSSNYSTPFPLCIRLDTATMIGVEPGHIPPSHCGIQYIQVFVLKLRV
jgi:hypothetical protein